MDLTLDCVVEKFADAVVGIDSSGVPFRGFSPGVGASYPYC
jgi:orotate phosphoribosyltransferase-like protein